MVQHNSIICDSKSDMEEELAWTEKQAADLLKEFKLYYSGDVGIKVYPMRHIEGWSVCADLTVNGELCRHYDPAEICFLDLNMMMLNQLIKARKA